MGSVLRHTVMNLVGFGLPLVAAVFTIPALIRSLGEERFGLLTLIWAIAGYFGLFDLGLGRALTQQISVLIARRQEDRVGGLVTTSLVIMAALGLLAGLVVWLGAEWGVGLIKGVTDRQDAVVALRVMALAMPFIVLTSGLRGILEARFAFGALNLIRIPMGLLTFLGPVAVVAWWSNRLAPVAWVLTLGRAVACAAHAWFARRDLFVGGMDRTQLRPLLASGGWLTVSNIVSPLMGYADRFIIGGTLSAGVVAYYTTPNEIVLRIWVIPAALTAVLFPRFAQDVVRDQSRTWALFKRSVGAIFLVTLPVALGLALFAPEVLSLWVNRPFAEQSAPVLRVFAAGILFNCMAQVPYTLIQSANRPRVAALIHCAILPLFIALLWVLTRRFGLMGAVISWFLRITVDSALMFYFGMQTTQRSPTHRLDPKLLLAAAGTILLFGGAMLDAIWIRAAILLTGVFFAAHSAAPFLRRRRQAAGGEA